jgi:hypothetical protein
VITRRKTYSRLTKSPAGGRRGGAQGGTRGGRARQGYGGTRRAAIQPESSRAPRAATGPYARHLLYPARAAGLDFGEILCIFRPVLHVIAYLDPVRLGSVALYAAYGSNMDPAQMLLRCPHSPQRGTGWVEGWRLTFGGEELGWDGALTTVVEDAGQRIFVVLYDVPEVDEKELDSWDGVNLGFYSKLKVRVQTLDGNALAWLYVLDAYEGGLPSDQRLRILVDAAVKAGAPDDYIGWLRGRPSNPPAAGA